MRDTKDIPQEIMDAVRSGIEGALSGGIKLGYECTDIAVDVRQFDYNELTTTPVAAQSCAALAFDEVCSKAGPVLMEPVMSVKIAAPSWNPDLPMTSSPASVRLRKCSAIRQCCVQQHREEEHSRWSSAITRLSPEKTLSCGNMENHYIILM